MRENAGEERDAGEEPVDPAALARELAGEAASGRRIVVAIAGEPGSGKSTLAQAVAGALRHLGVTTATLPMDGFHLSNRVLEDLGRRQRKGAIDTFDGAGYVHLLRRVCTREPGTVYWPAFDHGGGEPVAAAIAVTPDVAVAITEGNYLLDDSDPWSEVAQLADHRWFVSVDPELRRQRLLARHVAAGKAPDFAASWVRDVDERNAERVRRAAPRAQRVLRVS